MFALVDETLMTPARGVLEGITRRTVIEIAGEQGLPVHVGDVTDILTNEGRCDLGPQSSPWVCVQMKLFTYNRDRLSPH